MTLVQFFLFSFWLMGCSIFLFFNEKSHQKRKCERCSPNSLWPISYFGRIWELYVLDIKTKVFCRKENQLLFPMDKGLTVPKQQCFGQKYPKCLLKFQPNLSAQSQKFRIYEKKAVSGCPQSVKNPKEVHMRQFLFLYYRWFLQNLEKGCIRTNMHTTVDQTSYQ